MSQSEELEAVIVTVRPKSDCFSQLKVKVTPFFWYTVAVGAGAKGAGYNPPSRSRRSPPAVFAVLLGRPAAELLTARLGCRVSSEPPSRSNRSHT